MTRGQIRTKLRRRLNEEVGDSAGGWTDAELNAEINDAYKWVQKEIYKSFPTAHLYWDLMDTVTDDHWYPLPETLGIRQVALKADSSATDFARLHRKDFEDLVDLDDSSTTYYYTTMGQYIGIYPYPAEAVLQGLRVIHTPLMAMAADDDVPRVKAPCHEAIVLKAKDSILGDLGPAGADESNRVRLADIINDLPLWYQVQNDEPERVQPSGL